jgi:hypothetical protein
VYQLDGAVDIFMVNDLTFSLAAGFAHKIGATHFDGYVINMPRFEATYNGFEGSVGLITAGGRLLEGQLSRFYMTNRAWIASPRTIGAKDTFFTQTSLFSEKKLSRAMALELRTNPYRGYALDIRYCAGIYDRRTLAADTAAAVSDLTYLLGVSVAPGIVPGLRFGRVSMGQSHGGVYPVGSGPFASWGYLLEAEALSVPLFKTLAITAGLRYFFMDLGTFDNTLSAGDNVFEMNMGVVWGIL